MMKRLTYYEEDGRALLTPYGATVYCSMQATADHIAKLEEKLAAYENTGLEPEEISSLSTNLDAATDIMARQTDYIEKLQEDLHVLDLFKEQVSDAEESIRIAEARRDGRLIVLPDNYDEIYNKRGDNIYALIDGDIHELLMTDTFIGEEHTLMIDCFEVDDVWVEEGGEPVEKEMPKTYGFPIYDVGKSVFLSREEAEKALEVQNGD